jgi:hypothetical protein
VPKGSSGAPSRRSKAAQRAARIERLEALEEKIEYGLATFVEVADALREIRDNRVYGDSYATFDAYLQDRWRDHPVLKVKNRQRASQVFQALEVSKILDGEGPLVESHARALRPLKDDPKALSEAWKQATMNGKPTAERVREAVTKTIEPRSRRMRDALLASEEVGLTNRLTDIADAFGEAFEQVDFERVRLLHEVPQPLLQKWKAMSASVQETDDALTETALRSKGRQGRPT